MAEPGNHADDELLRLMDLHEQSITNYLRVLLPDAQAVSDCVQDTFLRAYEHLRKGKPVTTKWLYTVARNRAMDEHRKGRRLHCQADDQHLGSTASPVDSTVAEDVREALGCLPEADRTVLYLILR